MTSTAALFVDVSNIYRCVSRAYDGAKLDYSKYYLSATEDYAILRAFAYGFEHHGDTTRFKEALKHIGFYVKYKDIESTKKFATWYLGLALDVVQLLDKLDVVILGSADPTYVDLVRWIQDRGVPCHIFACGIPKVLRAEAQKCIDITVELIEQKNELPDKSVCSSDEDI